MRRTSLLFVLALLQGACAAGQTIRFDHAVRLQAEGDASLRVGVLDARTYVRAEQKKPSFVGVQRGGYGNPFDVLTASGEPVATEIGRSLKASLKARGFTVDVVPLTPDQTMRESLAKLGSDAEHLAVLVVIEELRSDTMTNAALHYDLTVEVRRTGKSLAFAREANRESLGGSVWDPGAYAKEVVPAAWSRALERLFDNPDVVEALKAVSPPGEPPAPS